MRVAQAIKRGKAAYEVDGALVGYENPVSVADVFEAFVMPHAARARLPAPGPQQEKRQPPHAQVTPPPSRRRPLLRRQRQTDLPRAKKGGDIGRGRATRGRGPALCCTDCGEQRIHTFSHEYAL